MRQRLLMGLPGWGPEASLGLTSVSAMENIVAVGNGMAGTTAATILCEQGYRRHITIIGAERQVPYSRPALSKSPLNETGAFLSHLLLAADHEAPATSCQGKLWHPLHQAQRKDCASHPIHYQGKAIWQLLPSPS